MLNLKLNNIIFYKIKNMSVYNKDNKFISYIFVLISLFILVLFTKDQVMLIQENLDVREVNNIELTTKVDRLKELNDLKIALENSTENIDKYTAEIKEDEIIDYIYSYIEKTNWVNGITIVKSLSLSEPEDTEIWFKESNVVLNLMVANEDKLKEILNFLTSKESKYNFFITSFNYAYWNSNWNLSISIPLKILYK